MHLENHLKKIIFPLVLYIGIFSSVLNAEVQEPDVETLQKNGTVFVEPTDIVTTSKDNQWVLLPYRERRGRWGCLIGGGYSNYEPLNYQPNFSHATYRKTYGQPWSGLLELNFAVKRNLSAFSVGTELSVGSYDNARSNKAIAETELTLTEVRLGAAIYFDTLMATPYAVPYISGGGYTMIYKESLGGNTVGGNSQVAGYVNAGVQWQLDWIDSKAARVSYE